MLVVAQQEAVAAWSSRGQFRVAVSADEIRRRRVLDASSVHSAETGETVQ